MSPTRKARPVSPAVEKRKPLVTRHELDPARRELAFLVVGGIALVEGIALILLVRKKK